MNEQMLTIISLTMSTIALAYPFLKDFWEKPKLRVCAGICGVYIPGREKQSDIFSVTITNIGGKPLVINGHAFEHFDGTKSTFPDAMSQFSLKKLDPYDAHSVNMSNQILENMVKSIDLWNSFAVYDTKGKAWYLSKSDFNDLKNSLKKRQQPEQKESA